MPRSMEKTNVYLEIGKKRSFAGAVDWPGWCRSGRDEASALQALVDYGQRYARVVAATRLGFRSPTNVSQFAVIERLDGDATTDFGAPGKAPSSDSKPVDAADLVRLQRILKACWQAFDAAVESAAGRELLKGPRGGGRDQQKLVDHVVGAEAAYLGRLGWKIGQATPEVPGNKLTQTRQAILEALEAASRGETPERGPRGGARWTARYFVRRAAWHVLDHAWEIEDRVV